jgi:acyl-CoA synthetase (AMP-forming)/AMP-acid ligase II
MRTSLHHLLQHRAASHPEAPALTYKNTTLDYATLWRHVCGITAKLAELGLEREQRVAVFLEKRIETVAAIFGTCAAGCTFVPVNPVLRPHQVAHIIADCGARVLVTSSERLALLGETLSSCPTVEHLMLVDAQPAHASPKQPHASTHGWPQPSDSAAARLYSVTGTSSSVRKASASTWKTHPMT